MNDLEELSSMELINLASKVVGSQAKLAAHLGVTQQTISYWRSAGVPLEYCTAIEVATEKKITRKMLRPKSWLKYWPELANEAAAAGQGAI